MTTETYFTPREAAEYLRSSTSTLAKARLTDRGPAFVRIGRAVRYRQSDIDAWMSASVAGHAKPPGRASTAPARGEKAP
jgi:excisionase family DNA binding protein